MVFLIEQAKHVCSKQKYGVQRCLFSLYFNREAQTWLCSAAGLDTADARQPDPSSDSLGGRSD